MFLGSTDKSLLSLKTALSQRNLWGLCLTDPRDLSMASTTVIITLKRSVAVFPKAHCMPHFPYTGWLHSAWVKGWFYSFSNPYYTEDTNYGSTFYTGRVSSLKSKNLLLVSWKSWPSTFQRESLHALDKVCSSPAGILSWLEFMPGLVSEWLHSLAAI